MRDGALDSNWWYGVAGPALMEVVGFGLLGAVNEFGLVSESTGPDDPAVWLGLVPALVAFMALFLTPVFAYCAYRDAAAVRASTAEWDPNPRFWGLAALVVPLAGVAASTALLWAVAAPYLYKRFSTRSVSFDPGADTASDPTGNPPPTDPAEPHVTDQADRNTATERTTDDPRARSNPAAGPPPSENEERPGPNPSRHSHGASRHPQEGGRRPRGASRHPQRGHGDRQRSPQNGVRRGDRPAAHGATERRQGTTDRARAADGDVSNWWYGVVAGTFCGLAFSLAFVAYLGAFATGVLDPLAIMHGSVDRSGFAVLSLFAVGGAFSWVLTTPVFALSLAVDVRRLRDADAAWQPDTGSWYAVAAGHVLALFLPLLVPLTVGAGVLYLKRRHDRLGRP